ncbi:MAG TPA: EAL domain-containing protein, partial [Thermoanaerobaculia bacterium]|nr:EAL domain-containing protein [Thermoanaerobaculia bacterium]
SQVRYRNIFNFAPVGIYQSTLDGRMLTANETLARILGYPSLDELLATPLPEIYFDPDERQELIRQYGERGQVAEYDVLWKRKDGTPIWVRLTAHSRRTDEGIPYFEGFVFDVTERKDAEALLRTQSAAMSASMDGIAILTPDLAITYANDALANLYGMPKPAKLLGQSFPVLFDQPEQERVLSEAVPAVKGRGKWRGEMMGRRIDGSNFPQEMSLTAIEGGGMVYVVRDISERTYAEEQIRHLAYHDTLTSLPNRLLFKDRLAVALAQAQRAHLRVAVLFLDLDRFKVINDSLGHNVGDELLQAAAERISHCVRESDTVARLGGDEFTLLLPSIQRSEDIAPVAQKILEAMRQPFMIQGREFFTTASIGISLYPDDGSDPETLIKNADTAMYQAKEQGRDNCQMFNADINAKALQRVALEHALRKALNNSELSLHYQPIFDLESGRIVASEALLRWQSEELGSVTPSTFIPVAETIGAMLPIGNWAMRTACTQARRWRDYGWHDLTLSINLSVSQLQQPDIVEQVQDVLRQSRLAARHLELEITESMAISNPEMTIRTLQELRKLGVRISLDDFGTGHSSLSYIKRYPIDTLKIDQTFVRDIESDADTAAIVQAMIAMAHSLRLTVIAEGVETEGQAKFLRDHGCDQVQGFLFSRPLPPEKLTPLIRSG